MVAIRIEFDDEQYERLKELKKHRGRAYSSKERRKSERIPLNKRRTWFVLWSVGFTPAVNGGTLSLIQVDNTRVYWNDPLNKQDKIPSVFHRADDIMNLWCHNDRFEDS